MSKPTFINSKVVYHDNSKEYNIDARGNDLSSILRACKTEEIYPIDENSSSINDIHLFKYIHPSITSEKEQKQISGEVQNLVQNFPLPEVCRYLRQMYKDKRVYLNVKIEAMFDELHRLGLPSEETPGYSFKNFKNYFNINE